MRFIEKIDVPSFFTEAVQEFNQDTEWSELPRRVKKSLKKHIRRREQKGLCAYCEIRISPSTSHVENIQPQNSFPEKRFDYNNLIVSCDGKKCRMEEDDNDYTSDVHSCGHKKFSEFNTARFLSPVTEKDISEYFHFDKEGGGIIPNPDRPPGDRERAAYTLNLLNLDNSRLNKYRLNARKALEQELRKIAADQGVEAARRKLNNLLSLEKDRYVSFISFLRFYFRNYVTVTK